MVVNILPAKKDNLFLFAFLFLFVKKLQKLRLITQTTRVKRPLCSYVLVNYNRGGNMIMKQNREYLLEKVDDATIWSFILWN